MEGRGNGRRAVWQRLDAERGAERGNGGGERELCQNGNANTKLKKKLYERVRQGKTKRERVLH